MSNIEIRNVRFEQDFLKALTNKFGQTALYIKDSYFQGKYLRFFDI
jgi:hypothetical protein